MALFLRLGIGRGPYVSCRLPHLLILFSLLFSLFFSFTPLSHAASVTLAWDPPASSSNVTGYKVYRGTVSGQYTLASTLGNQTQSQVSNLVAGTKYYFAVTAYNSSGESDYSNEIAYTVPTNRAPVADNGSVTTTVNTQVTGTLTASDANGDTLTYSLVTTGSNGKATLTNSSTGAFNYLPNSGVTGTDTFTFRAHDGKVYSNTATITVTINPANRAPVAKNRSISTKKNTRVYSKLIASDADGDSLKYSIVTKPVKGTVLITNTSTGAFSYTPYYNRTGADSFTFRVNDGKVNSNVATVSVTITTTATTSATMSASASLEASQDFDSDQSEEAVILLEAEEGHLNDPMTLVADPEASSGLCVEVKPGTGSSPVLGADAGSIEYLFDVPESGTYAIWGRVRSQDAHHNGFYVSVDAQPRIDWETSLGGNGTWLWSPLKEGSASNPPLFALEAGQHVLTIKQKDDGAQIDQILITGRSNHFGDTIYEDAEDGSTLGWKIASGSPGSAAVANVFDEDRESHVIELDESSIRNTYELTTDDLESWSNRTQKIIQWSMKSSQGFNVYVDVDTTEGQRYLVYSPVGRDRLGESRHVHLGLGTDVVDGQWHTFVRDLEADLQRAQPSARIIQVNGFAIRGGGSVDEVSLRCEEEQL